MSYVFVDVSPQPIFRQLRLALYTQVAHWIDCEVYGGPENVSHITVGYAHNGYSEIDALRDGWTPVSGIANELQIAEAGPRGTCQREITSIKMRSAG